MLPRSRVLLCSALLLLPLVAGQSPRADTPFSQSRQYDPTSLRFEAGPRGIQIAWEGLDRLGRVGIPDLPVDRFTVEVPAGQRVREVRSRATGWVRVQLDDVPVPYAGSLELLGREVVRDPEVYSGSDVYPTTLAEVAAAGFLRGRRLETVQLNPVRYLPGEGAIEVARTIEYELVLERDDRIPVRSRRGDWDPDSRFDLAADALVDRGPAAATGRTGDRFRPLVNGEEPFSPRHRPSEDGSPVRYLIITSDQFAEKFQRFADWKTAIGVPAAVRTMTWIDENYPPGVDKAEDVRTFIRSAVENWGVEYVLLGGDVDVVPIREGKSYYFGGEDIPTDMYYASLDGSWNTDGDSQFGEGYVNGTFPGDGADLYPDVWVGRAPVRTVPEVDTFIDKQIAYATEVPLGSGFGDRMLALGEVFFPQNWNPGDAIQFDAAWVCESAVAALNPATTATRLYENHTAFPGALPETKSAVVAEIESGYNLILHAGHGYINTMAVGIDSGTLTNADADGFYNQNRQGVLYAINCTSSALDFDCIAEHFVRNPYGGVVGTVGSTRLDFPVTGWAYQDEFFDLVHQQGVTRLGEAAALQKVPFIGSSSSDSEHRWTQFSLITLGDPDLDIYTGVIGQMSAVVTEPLELGTEMYTVTVTDGNGPVEGAVVCLNKADDAYGYAVTDASGVAQVPFSPDFPGKASLGLRAHNHRSRVDTVMVDVPTGPHLFVGDLTVDDGVGGDGDGFLEAGESAFLYPVVHNQGASPAVGIGLTLLAPPPGITILDGTASVPDIGASLSAAATDPFEVSAAVDLADLAGLTAQVQIVASGYSRQEPLVLYTGSPVLDLYAVARRDTTGNGNGDGTVQAGEDQHVRVQIANRGLGRSAGLTATLSSTHPAVTILDAVSSYGDLEPGESRDGDGFLVRFSDTVLSHPMKVTLTDQRGTVLVRSFELSAPSTPTGVIASGAATDITLKWTPVSAPDMRGYNIYRSLVPGGPYDLANPVVTSRFAYFKDEDLPSLTRYYYRVAAVDSSGNQGPLSGEAQATTSLPSSSGFPLQLSAATSSSPCIAYLDGDTKAEIISGGEEIYIVTSSGSELLDGDLNSQTFGVFSQTGFGPFWTPPSVGDMDGDGVPEIAAAGWVSGKLYIWESHGDVRPGWPQSINIGDLQNPAIWSAPAMGDVDGDGDMELFINAGVFTFGFHTDGTEIVDGDNDPLTYGVFLKMNNSANYSTPALADVDNDGALEVIVGSRDGNLYVMNGDGSMLPNFPFAAGGDITNSPAVGDLDKDGLKEMVFGSSNYLFHAIDINLDSPPGWPAAANMNQDYDSSPALADMDGDTYLDVIICAGNGTVYVYRGQNGWLHPGWPKDIRDPQGIKVALSSSPAVGNIDADSDLEFCFGANDGNLYAFNLDGSLVDGFPIGTANQIQGGPILWDIDNDGFTEVVSQSLDEKVYVWKSPGAFNPAYQPWPMFHQNSRRTGEVGAEVWIQVGTPAEPDRILKPVLAANTPNPFGSRTAIAFRIPESDGNLSPVRLSVYDVNGRRVRTLVNETRAPGSYEVAWDGSGEDGRRVGAGIYFYRLEVSGNSQTRKMVLLP